MIVNSKMSQALRILEQLDGVPIDDVEGAVDVLRRALGRSPASQEERDAFDRMMLDPNAGPLQI